MTAVISMRVGTLVPATRNPASAGPTMLIDENPRLRTALPWRRMPAGSRTATVAERVTALPVAAIVPSKKASAQTSGTHGSRATIERTANATASVV